jgi:hypothetical protein
MAALHNLSGEWPEVSSMQLPASQDLSMSNQSASWYEQFSRRQASRYEREDKSIASFQPAPESNRRKLQLKVFEALKQTLDPPDSFRFPALHSFLDGNGSFDRTDRIFPKNSPGEEILLDERKAPPSSKDLEDRADRKVSTEDDEYIERPPVGKVVLSKAIPLTELWNTLLDSVCSRKSVTLTRTDIV